MKKKEVDFEIGFADSTILSYSVKRNKLTVILECWNSEIIEIKFINFTGITAMNYFRIADIYEVFESPLLERALNELYEKHPESHNLRIFQFINPDDMLALEVVSENIQIKKLPH